jgi:hypothetical protein
MENKPPLVKQESVLVLSHRIPRSGVIQEGIQSATFLEILNVLRGPNTSIRSQIEEALWKEFIWAVFSRDTKLIRGLNYIHSDETGSRAKFRRSTSFLWTQVDVSEQANEDIRKGLPVGLYFGYNRRSRNKIITHGLETLYQAREVSNSPEEYHERIMRNWADTAYARLNYRLRVEGGDGWLGQSAGEIPEAPMVFKMSDPKKIEAMRQAASATNALLTGGSIPQAFRNAALKAALRDSIEPATLKEIFGKSF